MPNTANTPDSIARLQKSIASFARARDWQQFHTPKNLAMALSVEAAELMEIFQWLDNRAEVPAMPAAAREAVADEAADIFIYLLSFCTASEIDLLAAARAKLKKNALKYPAGKVKGKSAKSTAY